MSIISAKVRSVMFEYADVNVLGMEGRAHPNGIHLINTNNGDNNDFLSPTTETNLLSPETDNGEIDMGLCKQ